MLRIKKIFCLFLVVFITIAPAISLAKPDCCIKDVTQKETPMKCHESGEVAQSDTTHQIAKTECDCDCGMCKISTYNGVKANKNNAQYSEKFVGITQQVLAKNLAYGIFNPPKFAS